MPYVFNGKIRHIHVELNIAIIGKAEIIIPCYDYMIKQLYLQKLTGTLNLLGKFPVLFTWIYITGRMIMN